MLKLKNCLSSLVLLGILLFMVACSNTPNNVSISLNQGQCASPSQYSQSQLSSLETTYESYYNLLINNPTTTTPYCTSVTVQNFNSGLNANSIQITSNGLQVSTILPGTTSTTYATLYDSTASGISSISGFSQNINNLVLFDPSNCVTTTGASVQTLSAGGGSCTFYLEILAESSPVGVYPYYITYNYTNGNQNYTANATINQRVYLYGGDNSSYGLYYVGNDVVSTGDNESTTATWQKLSDIPSNKVTYVTANDYGTIYFAADSGVYSYNGITVSQVGLSLPATVNSIAFDSANNIYAAVDKAMWVYNIESSISSWQQLTDTNDIISSTGVIIGLKGFNNIIFAISDSKLFRCDVNGTTSESCKYAGDDSTSPSIFFNNAIDVDSLSGNVYTGDYYNSGSTLGLSKFYGDGWRNLISSPTIESNVGSTSTTIGGVKYAGTTVYFGVVVLNGESSVYNCSYSCAPKVSSDQAPITGNANTLTTDGSGNLYVAGSGLNSTDYGTYALTTGAFLLFGTYAATSSGQWQTILSPTAYPENISSVTVASMLTSY